MKGLKALNEYKRNTCIHCQYYYGNKCNNNDECFIKIIEQELKDYEELKTLMYGGKPMYKQLQALEIIKKKRVDMDFLFEEWEEENWEFALENYNMNHEIELTQEEYELLKEVLL